MRIWPENRNPFTRLLSRRAYYHRHKEQINEDAREERRKQKETTESRIEYLFRLSKMSEEELLAQLDSESNEDVKRIIRRYINK